MSAAAKSSIDEIAKNYKKLLGNLKKNPTAMSIDDLRLINSALLLVHSVFSIVLPVVIRAFTGGVSVVGGGDYTCVRLIDEQIGFAGVFTLALVLMNYLSSRWADVAQRDVIRVMTIAYALVCIVSLKSLYMGGSFLYVIIMLVAGLLTFLHAQASGLTTILKKD